MNDRAWQALTSLALGLSAMALWWVLSPPAAPWQQLAESRGTELEFRASQVQQLQGQLQEFVTGALQDEKAKLADAVRLIENLTAMAEATLSAEQLEQPAVAEAIGQARERVQEWGK